MNDKHTFILSKIICLLCRSSAFLLSSHETLETFWLWIALCDIFMRMFYEVSQVKLILLEPEQSLKWRITENALLQAYHLFRNMTKASHKVDRNYSKTASV